MAIKLTHFIVSLTLLTSASSSLKAQIVPATWTKVVAGVSASGTLGSNTVAMAFTTGSGSRQSISPWSTTRSVDYTNKGNAYGSGKYVCAAMGTNPVNHLEIRQKDGFTLTFGKPVKDLVVYLASWRYGNYHCSAPFAIASGLPGSTTSIDGTTGNYVLNTPNTSTPQYGALRFSNISTLTIKDTLGNCCSGMWFTLGSGSPTMGCALATPYGKGCVGMSLTSSRPIAGTTMKMSIANMPAGTALAGLMIGLTKFDPGIPGIPVPIATNCLQFTIMNAVVIFTPTSTSHDMQIPLPKNVTIGVRTYVQAVAATNTHLASSNGLEVLFGNL